MLKKIFDFFKRLIGKFKRSKIVEIKPPHPVSIIHIKKHRANKRKKHLRKIAEMSRKKNRRKRK